MAFWFPATNHSDRPALSRPVAQDSGEVFAVGSNSHGQLGTGGTEDALVPRPFRRAQVARTGGSGIRYMRMAVDQNPWHSFGIGVPPSLVYFSGDWDVHWGYFVGESNHQDSLSKA